MRIPVLVAIVSLFVFGQSGCGRALEIRHDFAPMEVSVDDSTVVSVFAHGTWSRRETPDSTYSLRGNPFTIEIQVRAATETVEGAEVTLRDSLGNELATIRAWRIVGPTDGSCYSQLVADSVPLPYETISFTATVLLTNTSQVRREIKVDTLITHQARVARPFKLLEVLRGV